MFTKSDNIFFNTFEYAAVGIANISSGGNFINVNQALCRILETAPEELRKKPLLDFIHTEEQVYTRSMFRKCLDGEIKSFASEKRLLKSDSTFIYTNLTVTFFSDGIEGYFICVVEDITIRKEIERRLIESDNRYKELINNSPIAITKLTAGKDGYEFVNQEFVRQSGYTADEFSELSKDESNLMIHPDDRQKVIDAFDIWAKNGYPGVHNILYRIYNKQKEIVWLNAYCYTERDADGNITAMDQMYVDITGLKKTEDELKSAFSLLNATLESTEDGIMVADGKGHITSFNKKFIEIWNIPSEILESRNDEKAIGYVLDQIKNPEKFLEKVSELYSKPDEVSFDVIEFLDGRIIERYSQPQLIGNLPSGRVWSFRDVTERKKAEMIAEASLKEKETLLKEIHHRVKNNLQIVSSLLNLESKYVKDKDDLSIFEDSRSRVRSMALVHEALYKSKDFSHILFRDYIVNLSDYLLITYKTPHAKISLEYNIEPGITASIDEAIPCGLLINELLTNCFKYAFTGRETGTITINLSRSGKKLNLTVADNGVGMPDDIDMKSTKTLGFQLIETLVKQLNGEVTIKKGNGTAFIILFEPEDFSKPE